jgi:hypothetical protein
VEVITVSAAMLEDAAVRTSVSPHVGTKKDEFLEFSFLLAWCRAVTTFLAPIPE